MEETMSSRDAMRAALGNLLEEEMGEPYPELDDERDLREGLGLDSVDIVGLVMRIEREFRIRLSLEELKAVKTVGEMIDLVGTKLAQSGEESQASPPLGTDGQAAA
jgi:acyl carrier protein